MTRRSKLVFLVMLLLLSMIGLVHVESTIAQEAETDEQTLAQPLLVVNVREH